MCLLSVIIPVYNAAPYLDECLCSILWSVGDNRAEVEMLLIDDGSTDGSGEICQKYAVKEPNIRTFSKENGGVASARNLGLKYASGQYIAWVDPDDYVSDNWFCRIKEVITRNEPDVIVMDTVRFGARRKKSEIYGRPGGFVDREMFVKDVIRDIRMLSGLPNKVMKAWLFDGIQFDTTLPILEDYAAMPDILKSAERVYYIPQCLYHYRQHDSSLLHNPDIQPFQAVQIALDREKTVDSVYHDAAVTATAWQAFVFYRSSYLIPDFPATEKQVQFCREYIRKNLRLLVSDKELSVTRRAKMILLGWDLYKIFIRLKGGDDKQETEKRKSERV